MAKTSLENLSLEELLDLQDRVAQRIEKVAVSEIDNLEEKLARLKSYTGAKSRRSRGSNPRKGTKVPAKYRDPKTGETWTGRGMVPRWLRAHEEAGRKREDFTIAG